MRSFTTWLESTVKGLEQEIGEHPVFDSDLAATAEELDQLRTLAVLHRFLSQELERRRSSRRPEREPRRAAAHAA